MSRSLAGRRILIVDDEEDLRELLSREFRALGYETTEAPSGNKALAHLASHSVDVVVTDIRMPDGDGIHLLKQIKAKSPQIPIVVLITGYSDIGEPNAYHLGAEAVFTKPIDRKCLVAAVARSLLTPEERWAAQEEAVDVEFNIELKLCRYGQTVATGRVVRLGRRGVFVQMEGLVPFKDQGVSFRIQFEQGVPMCIEGTGVVRWSREREENGHPPGCGIEFLDLSESSRAEVIRIIETSGIAASIPLA